MWMVSCKLSWWTDCPIWTCAQMLALSKGWLKKWAFRPLWLPLQKWRCNSALTSGLWSTSNWTMIVLCLIPGFGNVPQFLRPRSKPNMSGDFSADAVANKQLMFSWTAVWLWECGTAKKWRLESQSWWTPRNTSSPSWVAVVKMCVTSSTGMPQPCLWSRPLLWPSKLPQWLGASMITCILLVWRCFQCTPTTEESLPWRNASSLTRSWTLEITLVIGTGISCLLKSLIAGIKDLWFTQANSSSPHRLRFRRPFPCKQHFFWIF